VTLVHFSAHALSYWSQYSLDIYSSSEVEARYTTQYPVLYAFVAVFIFSASSLVFLIYDYTVQRRQKKVMQSAENANAIVSSIFPANVQERILQNAEEQAKKNAKEQKGTSTMFGVKRQLRRFVDNDLSEAEEEEGLVTAFSTKPIADLFTAATVMFADISGFTAWSSVREPSQVFTLLETVYAAFDKVAKSLKVFKVETIGKERMQVCRRKRLQLTVCSLECFFVSAQGIATLVSHCVYLVA
jgi:Adenylate and Guanylate cyclase catalytic domain